MSEDSGKFYPPAASEIAKLLGLEREVDPPTVAPPPVMVTPTGLPILDTNLDTKPGDVDIKPYVSHEETPIIHKSPSGTLRRVLVLGANALPYIAVFAIGVLVYYIYLADPSNRPQLTRKPDPQEQQLKMKQEAIAAIKKDQSNEYYAWISQFYFDVTDPVVTDMETVGANKLSNFENYLLNLNPKTFSTLDNGKSDAQSILEGINPKTGARLTDRERDIIAKYFDTEVLKSRVGGTAGFTAQTTSAGSVAGSGIQARGTPPLVPSSSQGSFGNVTTATKSKDDCAENKYKINTSIPGRLEVPSIGVNVPIIWTKDQKNFDTDLKSGVVHYPCTPLPGDIGTSYISGHSSSYAWVKADFNRVFAKLNELPDGATFKVTIVNNQGQDVKLHYVVERKQEFKADDQAQFANYAESRVALSTCWPINTIERRLVAFGKLSYVD